MKRSSREISSAGPPPHPEFTEYAELAKQQGCPDPLDPDCSPKPLTVPEYLNGEHKYQSPPTKPLSPEHNRPLVEELLKTELEKIFGPLIELTPGRVEQSSMSFPLPPNSPDFWNFRKEALPQFIQTIAEECHKSPCTLETFREILGEIRKTLEKAAEGTLEDTEEERRTGQVPYPKRHGRGILRELYVLAALLYLHYESSSDIKVRIFISEKADQKYQTDFIVVLRDKDSHHVILISVTPTSRTEQPEKPKTEGLAASLHAVCIPISWNMDSHPGSIVNQVLSRIRQMTHIELPTP